MDDAYLRRAVKTIIDNCDLRTSCKGCPYDKDGKCRLSGEDPMQWRLYNYGDED